MRCHEVSEWNHLARVTGVRETGESQVNPNPLHEEAYINARLNNGQQADGLEEQAQKPEVVAYMLREPRYCSGWGTRREDPFAPLY